MTKKSLHIIFNARHPSSGRQQNFVAVNRGRHLYSAGRPSRWALAHISSFQVLFNNCWYTVSSCLYITVYSD